MTQIKSYFSIKLPTNINVMLLFYLQPILLGNLLVRIPHIKEQANLNKAELATGILGLPIGSLILLFIATILVRKLGIKRILMIGFPFFMIFSTIISLASNQIQLFFIAMLIGASMAFTEVGLNLHAAYAERASKKMIMNRSHGCWSLGEMSGGLIGSLLVFLSFSTLNSMIVCMVLTLPVAVVLINSIDPHEEVPDQEDKWTTKSGFAFSAILICIGIYLFCMATMEGAGAEWSALYLIEIMSLPEAVAGLGFSIFAAAISVTRLSGDYLSEKIGHVPLARILCVFALIGLTFLIFPINAPLTFLGFTLLGIGIALGFPLSMSAAGKLAKDPSFHIAFLSVMAIVSFLSGPLIIGFVSEAYDLRYGFGILVPLVIIGFFCTFALRQKKPVE